MKITRLLTKQLPLWVILVIMCVVPSIPLLLLNVVLIVLVLIPREHTRQVRRKLSKFVYWQWVQGSWVSTRLHQWLWTDANGLRDSHYRKSEE